MSSAGCWGVMCRCVAELLSAALDPRWGGTNRDKLLGWLQGKVVITATADVVEQWSRLAHRLRGMPLQGGGANDMWVAACALAHALPVATGNLNDFQKIAAVSNLLIVHPDRPPSNGPV